MSRQAACWSGEGRAGPGRQDRPAAPCLCPGQGKFEGLCLTKSSQEPFPNFLKDW